MKIKDRSAIPFHVIKGILLTLLSVLCVVPFIVIISGSLPKKVEKLPMNL